MCKILKCGKSIWDLAMNICIGLIGVVFVAYGGYFTATSTDSTAGWVNTILDPTSDTNPLAAAEMIIITIVGLILLGAGCLGIIFMCCKKLSCLSFLLTIAKVLVSSTLIIIVVLVAISMATASSGLEKSMYNEVQYLYDQNDAQKADITAAWDGIQQEFACCGSRNYTDYYTSSFGKVPQSCCGMFNSTLYNNLTICDNEFTSGDMDLEDNDFINTAGCYTDVEDYIMMRGTVILILILAVYALQIADLIISCICCPTKISPDD